MAGSALVNNAITENYNYQQGIYRATTGKSHFSYANVARLYQGNGNKEHGRDHLPIEEQLQYYKQRDLRKVKIFKLAASLWGGPESRKRKIIAPPMEKKGNEQSGNKWTSSVGALTSPLRPRKPVAIRSTTPQQNPGQQEEERRQKYKNWMAERKKFRHDLDNMGLSEKWLERKPDKTVLEQRVLRRMIEDRTPKITIPPPKEEEVLYGVVAEEAPLVKKPSPKAIGIIEDFLTKKRIRLIDLFSAFDKDKSWTLSREEFKAAIRHAKIPISDVLLEDLVLSLDNDLSDELDYRELAAGMGLWRKEKRDQMLASLKRGKKNKEPAGQSLIPSNLKQAEREISTPSPIGRVKSAISNISSGSSQYLEPPEPDLRLEQMVLSSEEAMVDLRKRDREALSRFTEARNKTPKSSQGKRNRKSPIGDESRPIRTGDPVVDAHCAPSTLGGETADMVDKFRQLKLREYNSIVKLCQLNSVPLTEDLLRKVLLYPCDKSHLKLKRRLRQPGKQLLPGTFASPPKHQLTSAEERLKTRVKISKRGEILMDSRHAYPSADKCEAKRTKMNLSTGKAYVRREVDCWMTFEEYDALTKHLAVRYSTLHGHTDDNAFWPGHLLDKIQLYMPRQDHSSNSLFTHIKPGTNVRPEY